MKNLYLIGVFWTLQSLFGAQAIVTRHDVEDQKYQALAKGHDSIATFYVQGDKQNQVVGNGTYVGKGWVVTAAHVADYLNESMQVLVGGERIGIQKVLPHPQWDSNVFQNDIALVQLQRIPPNVLGAKLYRADDEANKQVLFLGRGDYGNGKVGIIQGDGVLRAAQNRIESSRGEWLNFTFDPPQSALPLEGISGPGDSGGPALVFESGEAYLIGVSSWQDTGPSGGKEGHYGVTEHYSRISVHSAWLAEAMAKH